jgi:hypothetical protein
MKFVGHGKSLIGQLVCFLGLSMGSLTAMDAVGDPDTGPASISEIESSLDSVLPSFKSGLLSGQQTSVIEEVEVDKSAQPIGNSELEQSVKFRLNGIQIKGNTVLGKDDVISLVKPYIDTIILSTDLNIIAQKITQLFIDNGYATTKCIIPAQQITNGVVTLQVVEDRLGQIRLSGEETYRYDVRLFLSQLHDLQGEVIHLPTLNSRLRYLSKLPATRVQPTLVKQAEGTTDLVLKLTDLGNQFRLSLDNAGSRFTGEERLSYGAVLNNFTGNSDVLSMGFTTSLSSIKQLGSMTFNYRRPWGKSGGNLGMSYSNLYYSIDPKEIGGQSDSVTYAGGSGLFGMHYEQSLWLPSLGSSQKNYSWSAGFDRKTATSTQVLNREILSNPAGFAILDQKDSLLVVDFAVQTEQYSVIKGFKGRSVISIALKHSLEGFFGSLTQEDIIRKLDRKNNAVDDLGPFTGPIGVVDGMDASFWKLYVDASRIQSLPGNFTAQFNFLGEYTPSKKVPQAYQFSGAGGGALGYSVGLKLMRPIAQNLILGANVKHSKAVSWYRDTDPGCPDSNGVNTALLAGRNTCTTNELDLSLDWNLGSLLAKINYQPNIDSSLQNNNNITFDVGYSW